MADPFVPVPPKLYGGIERIVDFLVAGLIDRGHDVTLWASPGSSVPCELVEYGVPPHTGVAARARELNQVWTTLAGRLRSLDVVHNFGRLAGLLPILPAATPKVQSYQRRVTPRSVVWGRRLANGSLTFTACSTNCRRAVSHLGRWETVYNGVRIADYSPSLEVAADAPLAFLGRIERIKGVHTAIAVAQRTGRRLVIAGNVVEEAPHRKYFEEEIEPHIDDRQIRFVGAVNDQQKNQLLGTAAALLMPIEWEEPFGIVMAEALACGTPVLGLRRGSVPEVIEDGRSGFVCETLDDLVRAVGRLGEIDRGDARAACERRFSDGVIVDGYERLYRREIARMDH